MKAKILLVDDDAMLLAGLNRQLRKKFLIETAISGEDAVKMVAEKGPYAVVVSDYMMPGMNGIELLRQVKQTNPDTIRMMLTGSADMTTAIKLYFHQMLLRKGIPFPIVTENGMTPQEEEEILRASEEAENNGGEEETGMGNRLHL